MNIYIQELKMSMKSAISWTVGLLFLLGMFMLMFPSISKDAALLQQVMSKFPPALVKALGMSTMDLSVVTGFYGMLFTYMLLTGSIYAMKSGLSVLSEEIRVKAIDFLLAKPVSRNTIVTAKVLSVLTWLFLQNLIYIPASLIIAANVSEVPFDKHVFLLISLSLPLVQLFFASFGLFLSVVLKKIKTVLPITMGVVFGFFILHMLNQSLPEAKLSYATPFAYFNTAYITENSGYEMIYLLLDIALILAFTAFSYVIYNKKDMPTV